MTQEKRDSRNSFDSEKNYNHQIIDPVRSGAALRSAPFAQPSGKPATTLTPTTRKCSAEYSPALAFTLPTICAMRATRSTCSSNEKIAG